MVGSVAYLPLPFGTDGPSMECYTHARFVPLLAALLFEPVATGVGYGTCPVVVSEWDREALVTHYSVVTHV